jgi:hypothetical protein
MKRAVLATISALLAATGAAGSTATKLLPLTSGALERDSGSIAGNWRSAPGKDVLRNGQKVGIYTNTWTLAGKHGTLVIRERIERVSTGADGNGDGMEDAVALGTWRVLRGTGAYAEVTGGGGSGHAGLGIRWNARFEGLIAP